MRQAFYRPHQPQLRCRDFSREPSADIQSALKRTGVAFSSDPLSIPFLDNDGNPTIMVMVKSMRNIIRYPATNAQ
ncbi:MAG: hypothetical protein ACLFTI_05095, partial [Anaerolineales bacterium]